MRREKISFDNKKNKSSSDEFSREKQSKNFSFSRILLLLMYETFTVYFIYLEEKLTIIKIPNKTSKTFTSKLFPNKIPQTFLQVQTYKRKKPKK